MKKGLLFLMAFMYCTGVFAQQEKYRLVWKEEFKGGVFNEAYWTKIPRGTPPWQKYMSDYDKLYEVKDGNLILRGLKNDGLVEGDTARYITGGLYTKDKMTIGWGKVEVRAKLNGAKGAWPAFWMLPNVGKWPDGGEIDIMERLNHDSIAYQTVHSHYTFDLKIRDPKQGAVGPIDPDGYNVYAVEILPDRLSFSINGKTFDYPKIKTDKEGQYPFGTPFYLLLDMQIGGDWVGEVDPADYPVEMLIDWVKFYELED